MFMRRLASQKNELFNPCLLACRNNINNIKGICFQIFSPGTLPLRCGKPCCIEYHVLPLEKRFKRIAIRCVAGNAFNRISYFIPKPHAMHAAAHAESFLNELPQNAAADKAACTKKSNFLPPQTISLRKRLPQCRYDTGKGPRFF